MDQFEYLLANNPAMREEVAALAALFPNARIYHEAPYYNGLYRVNDYPVEVAERSSIKWDADYDKWFDYKDVSIYRVFWHKAGFHGSLKPTF